MRTGRCSKCRHNRVLHVREVADSTSQNEPPDLGAPVGSFKSGDFEPLRIARVPNPHRNWLTQLDAAMGLVEAYVCRSCGYTELYTLGPDRIPVDGKHVREIVGPEGEGPYR